LFHNLTTEQNHKQSNAHEHNVGNTKFDAATGKTKHHKTVVVNRNSLCARNTEISIIESQHQPLRKDGKTRNRSQTKREGVLPFTTAE